jgi:LemA protein
MIVLAISAEFGLAAIAGGAAVLIALLSFVVIYFNRLVRCNNLVNEAFSGIDVQLKRRHELVPNLVECVKGYAAFERSLLEDVIAARSTAASATDMVGLNAKENGLTANLAKLFAIAEAYPEVKANTVFLKLSGQLIEIEDAIQYSRRYFNGAVRRLNITIESFPSNLVASWFQFTTKDYFEVDSVGERFTPTVTTRAPS